MSIASTAKANAAYKFSIFNFQPSTCNRPPIRSSKKVKTNNECKSRVHSFLEKNENQSFLLKILCKLPATHPIFNLPTFQPSTDRLIA